MSLIALDNFSTYDIDRTVGNVDMQWLSKSYQIIGNPVCRIQSNATLGRSALNFPNRTTNATLPYMLSKPIPLTVNRFSVGQRIANLTTNGWAAQSASIGLLANLDGSGYKTVFTVTMQTNAVLIGYNDLYLGPRLQTELVSIPADSYLDIIYDRVNGELVVTVNNAGLPRLYTKIIPDTDELTMAIAGTISASPDVNQGIYLNEGSLSTTIQQSLGYYVTDLYIDDEGKRYGKPIVESRSVESATEDQIKSNDPDQTVTEILNGLPVNTEYATGLGISSIETEASMGEVVGSVVRTFSQSNRPEASALTLTVGSAGQEFVLPDGISSQELFDTENTTITLEL